MPRKIYKKLTKEQQTKGVIFSSTLSRYSTEQQDDTVHEVKQTDANKDQTIKRLLDDSFFKNSGFFFNIVRK